MEKNAVISDCGKYRYHLMRRWDMDKHCCNFVMLNPSTADANVDDPTIRRCIGFAKDWGFGGIEVTNLFAFRATNPKELYEACDPVGPENHNWIEFIYCISEMTVFAWGAHGEFMNAGERLMSKAENDRWFNVSTLGYTKGGQPKHPLYLSKSCQPIFIR